MRLRDARVMDFKKFFEARTNDMSVLATAGTIGMHMVSGPLVGFAIGYGLDRLLGTHPWMKLAFLLIGVGAGFKNVYDDTQKLLKKMKAEDAQKYGPHH